MSTGTWYDAFQNDGPPLSLQGLRSRRSLLQLLSHLQLASQYLVLINLNICSHTKKVLFSELCVLIDSFIDEQMYCRRGGHICARRIPLDLGVSMSRRRSPAYSHKKETYSSLAASKAEQMDQGLRGPVSNHCGPQLPQLMLRVDR